MHVVEASISIVLVLSVLFVTYQKQQVQTGVIDWSQTGRDILEEIAKNNTLREDVISNSPNLQLELDSYVLQRLPDRSLNYEIKTCDVSDVCGKSTFTPGDVYVAQRIISSTIVAAQGVPPKKLRLFIWR